MEKFDILGIHLRFVLVFFSELDELESFAQPAQVCLQATESALWAPPRRTN